LALGGFFSHVRQHRGFLYFALFMAFSYVIMCNVRYAMNLRYASIWDLPIRTFALAQIILIARNFGRREPLVITGIVAMLCVYDLRQYQIFFVDSGLYELVSEGLLRAVKILK